MNTLRRISLVLIAVPLVATLWTSFWLIPFVQPERADIAAGRLHSMFSYENYVHESGFARLTLAVIGLLILFVPYRKGERWALAAVCILIFAYQIPVFFFGAVPNLGTWPIFRNLPELRSTGVGLTALSTYSLIGFSVLGLALGLPQFHRRKTT